MSFSVEGLCKESATVCFGCYSELDDDDPECCDFCGLPMCTEDKESCQISSRHSPECRMIQSVNARSQTISLFEDPALLHEAVLVMRTLSLSQEDLENFMKLEDHMEATMEEQPEAYERMEKTALFITNCLHVSDPRTVIKICCILDVNSFEVPIANFNGIAQAVYRTACLMEHNCIPNTFRVFQEDLSVTIRASLDIGVGSHITCIYTDPLWTTIARKEHLISSKFFECQCLRCSDPTECETYLSALKCSKCPVGSLLSTDPFDTNADWICDACQNTIMATMVEDVNRQVTEVISLLEAAPDLKVDQCEMFVLMHSRFLHEHHASMLDIKHTWLHLLGHSEANLMAELNDKKLQTKEDLARLLIGVADKILPGN